jgi:hypothetical protein
VKFHPFTQFAIMGRLSAADQAVHDQNLAVVKGVIEFNDAHDITYSRGKLYKYFNINSTTISRLGLSSPPHVKKIAGETEAPNLKRERPDDESTEPTSSTPPATPQLQRKNLVRDNGRDRKRLKLMLESLVEPIDSSSTTPSASSPQYSASPSSPQLLTPPGAKNSRGRKRLDSQSEQHIDQISQVIKFEPTNLDEETPSEPSARAPLEPSQLSQLQRRLQGHTSPIAIN